MELSASTVKAVSPLPLREDDPPNEVSVPAVKAEAARDPWHKEKDIYKIKYIQTYCKNSIQSSPWLFKKCISHLLKIISVLHLLRKINTVRGIRGSWEATGPRGWTEGGRKSHNRHCSYCSSDLSSHLLIKSNTPHKILQGPESAIYSQAEIHLCISVQMINQSDVKALSKYQANSRSALRKTTAHTD